MNTGISIEWEGDAPAEAHNGENIFEIAAHRVRKETLRFPQSARAHATLGIALAKLGEFDDAIAELREALVIDPDHLVAGLTLGRVLGEQGRMAEAKEIYQQLQERLPRNESVLLSLAYIALREGQLDNAERYLQESLKTNKKLPHSHFLLGLTRLERRNTHGAIAALREATRLDVRNAALHHALGVAYAVAGDNVRSERSFRTALTLSPDATGSVHALCEALLAQGRAEEVVEQLKPRVEDQDTPETRDLLGRAYIQLKRYANARNHLKHVLAKNGERLSTREHARFLNNIAGTFRAEGDLRAAETELLRALAIEPEAPEFVYENLGRLYIDSERFEDAIDVLRRGSEAYRDNQAIRLVLSGAYAHIGQFDAAVGELRPFWEAGKGGADTYTTLGWLYELMDDHRTALAVSSEAYQRYPKDAKVINNLAYTLLMLGNVDEARTVLKSLPRRIQPHAEMVATEGLLHLACGDEAGGVFLYEKAERMAREVAQRELAKRIRQKLHLELARVAARQGNFSRAQSEIRKGMLVRPAAFSFDRQLQQLSSELANVE
jgi:Flp pilus assembly protein TadD